MIGPRARRVAAVVLRQAYLLRGSPARILPLFAWVAIDVVLWGFISRYLNRVAASGLDFVPLLLGAVLLWDFFSRVMHGVSMAFFEDVWSRNFLNVFATPITTGEYVSGLVVSAVLTSTLGLAVMLGLAAAAFGLSFAGYGLAIVPALLILFMFGIALGILGCAIVLRLGPAAEWLIWPIPAVLSPFVGVFYPIATLPRWMQAVSWLLAPSYVFEQLRALTAGRPVSWAALGQGALLAAGTIVLAGWAFVRVYRYAVRTGLLARYSAETVS
ncbi:ABC transporter permease [Anaeromyxobacter dehalogenans]|uniref:ABC transporter, inner membrane subunit n=1 Tax=Anaeromyxobacter dehalogenans (strain 2CP-C) TaxID=290397 RepID=Q2IED0_ANADE|nr:ABC transporter permease [Anaeromyxobacter dehalogenans]ABC82936.1 ABC transporter, inner membrane subunit [Anaeromyxobacter dehalogenans 2CP-C]